MSISLLCRGYFPLSFTNSDIICSFIAALASTGQPPPGQTILQIAELNWDSQWGEGRPCQIVRTSGWKYHSVPTGQVWSGLARWYQVNNNTRCRQALWLVTTFQEITNDRQPASPNIWLNLTKILLMFQFFWQKLKWIHPTNILTE